MGTQAKSLKYWLGREQPRMLDNIWFLNTLIGYENVEYRQKYRHFLLQPEAKNCGTADTWARYFTTLDRFRADKPSRAKSTFIRIAPIATVSYPGTD
jgi:hypothetical protein